MTADDWKNRGKTQIPNKLIFDRTLTPHQKLVYGAIRAHKNAKDGRCFPSIRTIQKETGLAEGTVKTARNKLKKSCYLSWKTEWFIDDKGKKKLRCYYDTPFENSLEEGGQQMTPRSTDDPRRGSIDDPGRGAADDLVTIRKEQEEIKRRKLKSPPIASDDATTLSELLKEQILSNNKNAIVKNGSWPKEADLMIRKDKRKPEEIKKVIIYCQNDSFWKSNIMSMKTLRKQYDRLVLQMKERGGTNSDYVSEMLKEARIRKAEGAAND